MALDTWQTAIDNKLALENGETELKQASSLDVRNSIDVEDADKIVSAAEKRFGTTNNFKYAGYIDTNGKLLDFSDGQKYRVMDHREISEVLDLPEDAGYSDGLIAFMNLGNIRMNEYGIDISVAPNNKQKSKLRDFFNSLDGEVTVDFSKENGDNAGSADYQEGTSSSRILKDIDLYFETKEVPEGNMRYSIEVDSDGKELTEGQKEYFNGTKAIDVESEVYNGEERLAKVYHGTVREFYEFKREYANAEGNLGKGYYFTSNPYDVEENYANAEGKDLTNKIEREADILEGTDEYEGKDHEEIVAELKKKYITSEEPITLECYLNIQNPVYISTYKGNKPTASDYHGDTYLFTEEDLDPGYDIEDFDDEDEYYEQRDQAIAESIEELLWKVDHGDEISDIVFEAYYNGGIKFEDFKEKLNELYLEDEEGFVANEVARQVVEALGYDGIIDYTPFYKFPGMHLQSMTTHYVVFDSNQAKLITNENPTDKPDIRYSVDVDSEGNELTVDQQKFFYNSEVRDEEGRLIPLYHTTNSVFTKFNTSGIWLSEDKDYSLEYADKIWQDRKAGAVYDKNEIAPKLYGDNDTYTMKLYANITNPFDSTVFLDNTSKYLNSEFAQNTYKAIGITNVEDFDKYRGIVKRLNHHMVYELFNDSEFHELLKKFGFD
jgi:hypothetical protein